MKTISRFWMMNTILLSTMTTGVTGQTTDGSQPHVMDVEAKVKAVTVYRGRASVTRQGVIPLKAGVSELRFLLLPESIQPQTLQARVSGGAHVLEVQYDQVSMSEITTPETAQLDAVIKTLESNQDQLSRQIQVIQFQENFLSQVGIRATNDATDRGGTSNLDLDAVREQFAFVTDEQIKLLEKRGELETEMKKIQADLRDAMTRRQTIAGSSGLMRLAIVTLEATEAGDNTIDLTYLVTNATWQPTYNVRAASDGSSVTIEYDAMLNQRTGEDWNGVTMTLSTAQPTMAANPPRLQPWYVDVQQKNSSSPRNKSRELMAVEGGGLTGSPVADEYSGFGYDAEVAGEGPAVSYRLPRPVTVKTNIAKQQRSRIANIQTSGEFIHLALPALTESVYIRGELTNSSEYQLLPGPVSIFVDQDFVGPTQLDSIAPGGAIQMFFGIDPSITITRTLLEKKTSKTGLLGGGLKTTYDYRIVVENGAGKAILLEIWDRTPVSRSDRITVDLVNLSHPLAQDTEYVQEQRPQGLLKWSLGIPSEARGANALVLKYGVRINRAKDVKMTPLPD
ncbi:MAG: mucoidy inhibitor MuiA family protein [Planctomycetota bacterium]|nr:mucoidy inhibitor MuiA family protein [Planctomycetota bacterium]